MRTVATITVATFLHFQKKQPQKSAFPPRELISPLRFLFSFTADHCYMYAGVLRVPIIIIIIIIIIIVIRLFSDCNP